MNEKILNCGFEVFYKNGIAKATISEIANKAGVARRTIYRYFKTKDEIVYAVMVMQMDKWNLQQQKIYEQLSGTGLEKLKTHLYELKKYMESNPQIMVFMMEFDYYFKDDYKVLGSEFDKTKLYQMYKLSDILIGELIQTGLNDGSIKRQRDIELMEATITNSLWIFGQAIAVRGIRISEETNVDAHKLIDNLIEIYIDALKQEESCDEHSIL